MTMAMWIKIIMTIFNCNAMFGTQGVHLIAIQISSSRSPFHDDDNDDDDNSSFILKVSIWISAKPCRRATPLQVRHLHHQSSSSSSSIFINFFSFLFYHFRLRHGTRDAQWSADEGVLRMHLRSFHWGFDILN